MFLSPIDMSSEKQVNVIADINIWDITTARNSAHINMSRYASNNFNICGILYQTRRQHTTEVSQGVFAS